jgi:hypothetical protein
VRLAATAPRSVPAKVADMSKPLKQKAPKRSRGSSSHVGQITDPRFANMQTDPVFRLPSKKSTHVQLDKRFSHMLTDERFNSKAKVDRYGRRLPGKSGKKELERLYRADEKPANSNKGVPPAPEVREEDDEEEDADRDEEDQEEDDDEEDDLDDDEQIRKELMRVSGKEEDVIEGVMSSESDSEEESDDELDVEDEEEQGIYQEEVIPVGEVTSRLAVVNLDWDNIRAADLMAVFSSFAPAGGRVLNVAVYPSEFGKERMQREEVEGPPAEIFAVKQLKPQVDEEENSDDDDEEGAEDDDDEKIKESLLQPDDGAEFSSTALRSYQLSRLKYYYAVLTCSSPSVAKTIYDLVDGTEYLSTANFFDLRFIPDDTEFSEDTPRDECDKIPDGYRPNEFVTDALQHSKVRLTWDADDPSRKEAQKRAFSGSRAEIDENDLKAYLGSDSSDNEDELRSTVPIVVDSTTDERTQTEGQVNGSKPEEDNPNMSKKEKERLRMRALLGLGAEPIPSSKSRKAEAEPKGGLQITFTSGLSDKKKGSSVFVNTPEEAVETTMERYVNKERERKARRKEKMKAARNGEPVKKDEAEDSPAEAKEDLGFDDPFFTAPEEDKAAGLAARKEAKRKKRAERAEAEAATDGQRAELELLMVDEADRGEIKHFDINAISRAEKVLKRKGKKVHKSERDKDAVEAKQNDEFEMNVADPRFGAVFEKPEFAVDPSHPRFKGTEGMKKLLEEGRKKRRRDVGDEMDVDRKEGKKAKKAIANEEGVDKLVEKVKNRSKGRL